MSNDSKWCGDPCDTSQEICILNIEPDNPVNPEPNVRSVCDKTGYGSDNIWIEKKQPGYKDRCRLDLMLYGEVIQVLRRIPYAGKHLLEVTTDPCLVYLANNVRLYSPEKESNKRASDRLNRNTLPFYTVYRGRIGGGF